MTDCKIETGAGWIKFHSCPSVAECSLFRRCRLSPIPLGVLGVRSGDGIAVLKCAQPISAAQEQRIRDMWQWLNDPKWHRSTPPLAILEPGCDLTILRDDARANANYSAIFGDSA